MMDSARDQLSPSILRHTDIQAPSIFAPEALSRKAGRQRDAPAVDAPEICVLDPDGDIVDYLLAHGQAPQLSAWVRNHTDLYVSERGGIRYGVVGSALGAAAARASTEDVLVDERQRLDQAIGGGG